MATTLKPWAKDALVQLTFVAVGIGLVVLAHWIDPTNLAGPGLDIPMFFIVFISSIIMLGRSISKISGSKTYILSFLIILIGFICLILMMIVPANSW